VEKFLNWGLEKQGLNCSSNPSITLNADGTSNVMNLQLNLREMW